jgi:hypothetical protein
MCGIKLKVPKLNLQNLRAIEDFIKLESPKRKLKLLKRTLFNARRIRKTLDVRMLTERKPKQFKLWREQPNKILKQKINIRRIKERVKRRLMLTKPEVNLEKPSHPCPVYLCPATFHATEEELVKHYNKHHKDLVDLGLEIDYSKNKKRVKKEKKAQTALLNDRPESSDDSLESAEDRPLVPENDKYILDAHCQAYSGLAKNGKDIFGLKNSRGLFPHEVDSDLEDMLTIERELLNRR